MRQRRVRRRPPSVQSDERRGEDSAEGLASLLDRRDGVRRCDPHGPGGAAAGCEQASGYRDQR